MRSIVLDRFYEPLRKKAETIKLSSAVLFEYAQQGYLQNGRGAIFFLYQSEHDLVHDSDHNQYNYVHLAALVDVTSEPVWKMVQEYEPRQSFVLLLGVRITAGHDVEVPQLKFYTVVVSPACVRQLQTQMVHNMMSRLVTPVMEAHYCFSTSCCKEGKLRCARCEHVWYCSAECQLEDWKYHKTKCFKK